jgi:hypothetical protein
MNLSRLLELGTMRLTNTSPCVTSREAQVKLLCIPGATVKEI